MLYEKGGYNLIDVEMLKFQAKGAAPSEPMNAIEQCIV